MNFKWIDYTSEYAPIVDSWLDENAVKMTGIDSGWEKYWRDSLTDAENYPGCKEFCKIVIDNGIPFAVIKYGFYCGEVTIAEIVVDAKQRGKGKGTSLITELLLNYNAFIDKKVDKFTAVIFPSNIASHKAFEKAGFSFDYTHEDGDVWYYTYKTGEELCQN